MTDKYLRRIVKLLIQIDS